MYYLQEFKLKIKFEDIMFFIIIGLLIFIALWLLSGSPTITTTIISVVIFVATSEMLLWKKIFSMDKNTAISFVRLKNDINNIDKKLEDIKDLFKNGNK